MFRQIILCMRMRVQMHPLVWEHVLTCRYSIVEANLTQCPINVTLMFLVRLDRKYSDGRKGWWRVRRDEQLNEVYRERAVQRKQWVNCMNISWQQTYTRFCPLGWTRIQSMVESAIKNKSRNIRKHVNCVHLFNSELSLFFTIKSCAKGIPKRVRTR